MILHKFLVCRIWLAFAVCGLYIFEFASAQNNSYVRFMSSDSLVNVGMNIETDNKTQNSGGSSTTNTKSTTASQDTKFNSDTYSVSFMPYFKKEQFKAFPNAIKSYKDKEETVKKLLESRGIDYGTLEIFLRIIKEEEILELWAKDRIQTDRFRLIKTYGICMEKNQNKKMGTDLRIPEGFYHLTSFYAGDPYYTRIEINFPNESDLARGRSGAHVAIHGGCFSTYCISLTDQDIKELYIMAVEAKSKGQEIIQAHTFPVRLDDASFNILISLKAYAKSYKLIGYWYNLKENYDYFEKHRKLQKVAVDADGKYVYLP